MTQRRLAVRMVLILVASCGVAAAQPSSGAVADFNVYVAGVETRLAQQRCSPEASLSSRDEARLRQGEFVVEQLTPAAGKALPGSLLHDWRGTAFVPGAKDEDFERLMENYSAYPEIFSPQVRRARVLAREGNRFQVLLRLRQRRVITVVLDITSDVSFVRRDARHGYSISRSTSIAEIASPGTAAEHALDSNQSHGFLWRINTYWSYEERDGGLSMRIESVSLTRSIPTGLGWAVGPFVESIPRESLEFTLRAVCEALRKKGEQK